MLVKAYGEHALGKSQCFEWFKKFKSGDFDVTNKDRGKPPKKFEDSELQALLDEDDTQIQQLADQLHVTQKAISERLKKWERSRKLENGYRMISMKDNKKTEKQPVKCCSPDTIESRFCIGSWLGMKNGFISRIPNN